MHPQQAELSEPNEYLDIGGPGYFSVLAKQGVSTSPCSDITMKRDFQADRTGAYNSSRGSAGFQAVVLGRSPERRAWRLATRRSARFLMTRACCHDDTMSIIKELSLAGGHP